ncbi:sulfatase family protein [Haloprofundus halobius]|uniref:sulfatase family protein n=1 Tax=Haloprofundus halobius TaxID=2876194 RepID=UPI001CCB54E4|nr:sulfatase [Haloprofundus halobius]
MRILYVDCDSLRADHLGCYGYHRNTTPTVDALADDGMRFTDYYASDLPCLPSRTALVTGRFGIHTGVVNHGGLASEPRRTGRDRGFSTADRFRTLPAVLRDADHRTALVSSFPTRHGTWHVLDGFEEWRDTGGCGFERADDVYAHAEEWLDAHATEEDWYLHVNFWDPHTPYDTPVAYGNPFADDPAPEWPDEETIREHWEGYGPHSARDLHGVGKTPDESVDWGADPGLERTPARIESREDYRQWIDGYDVGIRYMDDYIGELLARLERHGVREETLVIVSADHGENQGECNIYGDHHTADRPTGRVPLVMSGPGVGAGVDDAFHYALDLAPTLAELVGADAPEGWDGRSFAPALVDADADAAVCADDESVTTDGEYGREYLVLSQGALTCQRGVRWENWLLLRTYHDGVHDFDDVELYDLDADPHQTTDLADERPDVVGEGSRRLEAWHADRMTESARGERGGNPDPPAGLRDPLWTVIEEGGPYHATRRPGKLRRYVERLRETDREAIADRLERQYGDVL